MKEKEKNVLKKNWLTHLNPRITIKCKKIQTDKNNNDKHKGKTSEYRMRIGHSGIADDECYKLNVEIKRTSYVATKGGFKGKNSLKQQHW